MRVFAAVNPGAECREKIETVTADLKRGLHGGKWVPAGNLHFTLSFLGEVGPEIAARAADLLDTAAVPGVFDLHLRGAGAYPSERKASVLWLGTGAGGDSAGLLARSVRAACAECGVAPDIKEWTAHLTLARFRKPVVLAGLDVFERLRETEIGICRVDRFFLMQSHLRPDGPQYEILREYRLKESKA